MCHDVFPKVLDIANIYGINILKIDINNVKLVAGQHLVFTVPTVLVVKEAKEILRESRFINFQNLERVLSIVSDMGQ